MDKINKLISVSGKLSVCKITFGAEPKDYEIYDFVLKNYYRLNLVWLWQLIEKK